MYFYRLAVNKSCSLALRVAIYSGEFKGGGGGSFFKKPFFPCKMHIFHCAHLW